MYGNQPFPRQFLDFTAYCWEVERIEAYTDYRQFLKDFYEDRKSRPRGFSYRQFCQKAGLTSPSLLKEVMDGKRNLTESTIAQFSQGLGLTEGDAAFFAALVRFNQSVDPGLKQQCLEQMRWLRRQITTAVVPMDRYDYYSKWYLPVLRELAPLRDWNDDWPALARRVRPRIRAKEAREGIELLLKLGFLRQDGSRWIQAEPVIGTGGEVDSLAVRAGNREYARMGAQSIDELPLAERDVSTLIVGLPNFARSLVKQEIREFKERLIRLAQDHPDSDDVFAVNVQFFPLSQPGEGS